MSEYVQGVSSSTHPSSTATKVMGPVGERAPSLPRLEGPTNFVIWERRVKLCLRANGLWDACMAQTVGSNNDLACGLIVSTLSDNVLSLVTIEDTDYAYLLWNSISKLYGQVNPTRQVTTLRALTNLRMVENANVTDFISSFRNLVSAYLASGGSLTRPRKRVSCSPLYHTAGRPL